MKVSVKSCLECGNPVAVRRGRPRQWCETCRPSRYLQQKGAPVKPLAITRCLNCQSPLSPNRQKYCSDKCRYANRDRRRFQSPGPHLRHCSMQCAECGKWIWRGKTSKPEGIARCLECHRANPSRQPTKTACVDCSAPSYGIRCRRCRDVVQRIRPADDYRTRRRDRERDAPGLNERERKRLLAKWKRRSTACAYCPSPATTVDHVVPLVRGGTNFEGNLVPSCRRCNSSKAASLLVEWGRHGRTWTSAEAC